MLSWRAFHELRLGTMLPRDQIEVRGGWHYLGRMWVREGFGSSAVLRLQERPRETRAIELLFDELPPPIPMTILAHLELPLRVGMEFAELERRMGQALRRFRYAPDRETREYEYGAHMYRIGCTVLDRGGLIALDIVEPSTFGFPEVGDGAPRRAPEELVRRGPTP